MQTSLFTYGFRPFFLGAGLAASFAILNGMWYEMRENDRSAREAREQEAKQLAEAARGD